MPRPDYKNIPEIFSTVSVEDPPSRSLQTICDLLEYGYQLFDHPLFGEWNGHAAIDPFAEAMRRGDYHIHRTYVERTIAQGRSTAETVEDNKVIVTISKGTEYAISHIEGIWVAANQIVDKPDTLGEDSRLFVMRFRLENAGLLMGIIQILMQDVNYLILQVNRGLLSKRLNELKEKPKQFDYLLRVKALYLHKKDQLDALVFNGLMETVEIELSYHKDLQAYHEVSEEIRNMITQYLSEKQSRISNSRLLSCLMEDDLDEFCKLLESLTVNLFSHHDVGGADPEKVYHALLLGILNDLGKDYSLSSNREAGIGRFDIMLTPNNLDYNGVILEVKKMDPGSNGSMDEMADRGLQQIADNKYFLELIKMGHKTISFISAVFKGKEMKLKYKVYQVSA